MASNILLREIKPWKLEVYQRTASLIDFWIGSIIGLLVGGVFLSQGLLWQSIGVFCFAIFWIILRYSVKKRDFAIRIVFDTRNSEIVLSYEKVFNRKTETIALDQFQALSINSHNRMVYLQCQDGIRYETWIFKDAKPIQQIQAWLELNGKHIDISVEQTEISHSQNRRSLLQNQNREIPQYAIASDIKFDIQHNQFIIVKKPPLGGQVVSGFLLLLISMMMMMNGDLSLDAWVERIPFLIFIIPLSLGVLVRPMIFIFDAPTRVLSRVFRTWLFSTTKAYTLDQPLTLLISPKKEMISLYFAEGQSVNLYPFLDTIADVSNPKYGSASRVKLYHSFQIKQSVIDDVETLASWLKNQGIEVDVELEDKKITTIID